MRLADAMTAASRTDPGRVREHNEDLPLMDAARGIFGVIDGVGGEAGGEVAAATAQEVILQRLARPIGTPAERVREAIALANNEIFRRAQESPALRGMACVVTLALVSNGRITIGHVGDSRLYKLRADGVRKLTRDHSPVGEREDAGELGEVDAMRHPRRNEVFRDVGSALRDKDEHDFVDVIEEPLERDSAILVCSDGLSDMLTASSIDHIVRQHAGDPARVAEALVAAANDAGGKDNITVVYAERPRFAASIGGHDTQTPTEPLTARSTTAAAAKGKSPASATPGVVRRTAGAILRSRTAWFLLGTALGVVGALGLMFYVARTQVQAPRTLAVAADGSTPHVSIGAAMLLARPGDTVRVDPGEYFEQVIVADGVDLVARTPGLVTIRRPVALDPSAPGVSVGGTLPSRISGVRIATSAASPGATGITVGGAGATLELVQIEGPFARAVTLLPDSSVSMNGSRVTVAGALVTVPDGSHATLTNNIFTRATASAEPPITAGALSRLTLTGNLFAGFAPDIIRGVAEPRRKELLNGNIIVLPQAPPAAPRRQTGRGR